MCVARLANTALVSKSSSDDVAKTYICESEKKSPIFAQPTERNAPNLAKTPSNDMPLIRQGLDRYELSSGAKDVLMASWRKGTSKQYQSYLKRWQSFCNENNIDVIQPGVAKGVEFLVSLHKSGKFLMLKKTIDELLAA